MFQGPGGARPRSNPSLVQMALHVSQRRAGELAMRLGIKSAECEVVKVQLAHQYQKSEQRGRRLGELEKETLCKSRQLAAYQAAFGPLMEVSGSAAGPEVCRMLGRACWLASERHLQCHQCHCQALR